MLTILFHSRRILSRGLTTSNRVAGILTELNAERLTITYIRHPVNRTQDQDKLQGALS